MKYYIILRAYAIFSHVGFIGTDGIIFIQALDLISNEYSAN